MSMNLYNNKFLYVINLLTSDRERFSNKLAVVSNALATRKYFMNDDFCNEKTTNCLSNPLILVCQSFINNTLAS